MELVSRSIFIDTQYLIAISFNFEKEELKSLVSLSDSGYVKVYMTDVTDAEIKNHIKLSIQKAFEKINQSDARVLKGIPAFWQFLENFDEDKSSDILLNAYSKFKTACKIIILKTSDITIMEVYRKYMKKDPPFGVGAKKHEFPDAFALLKILKWTYEEDSYAYLLSGDIDWIEFSKYSWEDDDPAKWIFGVHKPRLFHLKDLPEFLNAVYKTEDELKNLTAFWNKLLEKRTKEVEKELIGYDWTEEWVLDTDEEVNVLYCYQVGAKILEKDIIKLEREIAFYSLTVDITVIAIVEYTDYSQAVYDKEDGVYRGWKEKVETHKITLPVIFDCTFVSSEGLEVNFKLTSVGYSLYLTIPFDSENILNLEEWTRNFNVYIYGVQNGKITESGEGIEEFDNFEAAHKVYPTLALHDSKDFTLSRESETPVWVDGPLTYFTSAAIDKLYGGGKDTSE